MPCSCFQSLCIGSLFRQGSLRRASVAAPHSRSSGAGAARERRPIGARAAREWQVRGAGSESLQRQRYRAPAHRVAKGLLRGGRESPGHPPPPSRPRAQEKQSLETAVTKIKATPAYQETRPPARSAMRSGGCSCRRHATGANSGRQCCTKGGFTIEWCRLKVSTDIGRLLPNRSQPQLISGNIGHFLYDVDRNRAGIGKHRPKNKR